MFLEKDISTDIYPALSDPKSGLFYIGKEKNVFPLISQNLISDAGEEVEEG